jgi:hypothetical protein
LKTENAAIDRPRVVQAQSIIWRRYQGGLWRNRVNGSRFEEITGEGAVIQMAMPGVCKTA